MSKATKDLQTPEEASPLSNAKSDPFAKMREEMERFYSGIVPANLSRSIFGRDLFGAGSELALPGLGMPTLGREALTVPSIDVHENDKSITLTAELPGMAEEDFDVTVSEGRLTLKGEKKYEKRDEKDEARVIERRYGSFQRSFTLPERVIEEGIEAKFDKGVLTITLPKRELPKAEERKIKIGAKL